MIFHIHRKCFEKPLLLLTIQCLHQLRANMMTYSELNPLRVGEVFGRASSESVKENQEEQEIKTLIEEKYKFVNDETKTRYRIAVDEKPDVDETNWRSDANHLRQEGGLRTSTETIVDYTNIEKIYPDSSSESDDRHLAWAFRSYAARRIVGGMETSISMYPYNVAISRSGKHWCGGSIIDEQWVLTAGHCFEAAHDGDKKKLKPFIVRAGSSFHNRGGYQARVNKAFYPNHYNPGAADYDYSLIRLDRPMPIGRNIAVLNLPSKDYNVRADDILIVTGWGSTDPSGKNNIPERMRFVPVPVMEVNQCQTSYRFYITPRMVCAGYATGGKDACNHDSGGPAVRDGVLIGIVSFGGKQCGDPRSPGVYSRVSQVTDWVERTITQNEAYEVPELRPKIKKARLRERELQRFKARVEEKKNKIKAWLRQTLNSPHFITLAKRKLAEAGYSFRRSFSDDTFDLSTMDDQAMDDINFSNQINERILEDDGLDEEEKMLRTLALQEIIAADDESREFQELYQYRTETQDAVESLEKLLAAYNKSGEIQ